MSASAKASALLCVLNTGREPVTAQIALPEPMRAQAAVRDLYARRTLPVWRGLVDVQLAPGEGMVLA